MLDPYTTHAATSSLVNPSSYSFGGSGFTLAAVPSPSAGLHLGSDKLGYHNGSSWLTYIDSSGNFLLSGSGDDSLSWNGEELRIGNRGVGPTVTYQFSGSLDGNIFDSSITTTQTYTTPVLGNRFLNNADGWDEGFHTKATFDRNDGPTFEWDVVVGHNDPATMVGLFKENPDSFDHDQQHHTFYFQGRDITIRENGNQIDSGLQNDWTSDNDFSDNQTYRLRITLLEAGARYEIYRNGDFTAPAFVYSSSTVTDQYVRPGASIHYSSRGIIFRGLAAGAQLGASTKISGNTIQTGKILSSNHSGTSNGSGMSTAGMAIDLDNGAISAKNFRIASDGSAVFSGTMTIGGTSLTSDNTLNANTTAANVGLENVDNTSDADIQAATLAAATADDVGLGNVDNTSDADIQTATLAAATADDVGLGNVDNISNSNIQATASSAANSADKDAGTVGGWTIHADKIFTGTDENVDNYTSAAGRLIISASGAIHSKEFYIDKAGNAGFSGTMTIGGTDLTETNTLNANTTAANVGLGNVDNTSDATAQAATLAAATADDVGLGNVDNTSDADIQAATLAAATADDVGLGNVDNTSDADIQAATLAAATKSDVGLGNVDNTSDADAQTATLAAATADDVGLGNVDNTSDATVLGNAASAANEADKTEGTVGGWSISSNYIHSGTKKTTNGYSTSGLTLAHTANGAAIRGQNFRIDTNGDAYFRGNLEAAGGTFAGSLRVGTTNTAVSTVISGAADGASSLQPGGAATDVNNNTTTISGNKIRAGALVANNHSGTSDGSSFSEAGISIDLVNGGISAPKFFVSASGQTEFGGVINAAAGITGSFIKGALIEGTTISGGSLSGGAIYVPDSSNPQFTVSTEGYMTASDASISGEITATSGQIGDWIIDPITKAIRDNDSEIILSPDPAEIQMFDGTAKKVIIGPGTTLTSTAGSPVTANISSPGPSSLPSATSTNYYVAVSDAASGGVSGEITNSTTGDKKLTLTIPNWVVENTAGSAQTIAVTAPDYDGTTSGQLHGLVTPIRKTNTAEIWLEAVESSNTNNVIGNVLLGTSTKQEGVGAYNHYSASSTGTSKDDPFLPPGSVVGSTEITLADGTVKTAENITLEDQLKVYDWTEGNNTMCTGSISKIVNKSKDKYYVVKTDSAEVKVSDDHGFWMDGNQEIKVYSLIPGDSKIYIVDGGELIYETVNEVEVVDEEIEVFTFKIPTYNNYISNRVLSHNPFGGTTFSWAAVSNTAVGATTTYSGFTRGSTADINLNVTSPVNYKLRYKVVFTAQAGANIAVNANGSIGITTTNLTCDGFSTAPTYDTSIGVTVPTNFVELKAGGIQIVSDADQYVRMPRLASGTAKTALIFEAKGGVSGFDNIRPNENSSSSSTGFDIGSTSYRFKNLYVRAIAAAGNITAFTTSGASDRRLKENIKPLQGALDKVLNLQGVSFDWKNKELGSSIGFIAQDFEKHIPELVHESKNVSEEFNDAKTIDYASTVAVLTEAIKELSAKVNELEKKLESKKD
jgi:hypothetical protein